MTSLTSQTPPEITTLLTLAVEKGANVEALEKLVGLYERVEDRRAATEFTAALLSFQAQCPPVRHNRTASFATRAGSSFTYGYADLAGICRTVNPILHPLGLSYTWDSRVSDDGTRIGVTCTVTHTAGHSVRASFEAPVDKGAGTSAAQDYAKILTFGERKSLVQVLGIFTADEDTDAALAGPITNEQYATLEDLLGASDVDRVKFLEYLKVDKLSELPVSRYDRTVRDLKARQAR